MTARLLSVCRAGAPRAAVSLVLALVALGGCASAPEPAAADPAEAAMLQAWVSSGELARRLGLPHADVGPGRSVLDDGSGRRVILFVGMRMASVAGRTLELSDAVGGTPAEAYVSSSDAEVIQSAWRSAPGPAYLPTSSGGASLVLPPPPPPAPVVREPQRAPAPRASENAASASELAQWSVTLRRKWDFIVVHHSASVIGCASQIDKWHRSKGWDGLGYDFVIGNGTGSGDGAIEVGYRWKQQLVGAHARVSGSTNFMNEHGIGICLVGDFDKSRPSAQQMRALDRLCGFLSDYCGIPQSNLRLHGDVKSTDCPGKLFPRDFAFSRRDGRGRTAAADAPQAR